MIRDRWQAVQERVSEACKRSGRSPETVCVVAVSKKVDLEKIDEAYEAGVRRFGENYVQEALPKIEACRQKYGNKAPGWHFIGALQSNKAKKVVGKFSLIHSVDRWSVAEALDRAGKSTGDSISILMEVNVAAEATKSGVSEGEIRPLLERISSETNLNVMGLMSFPPFDQNLGRVKSYFRKTRELAEQIGQWKIPRVEMKELSMGVTHDFDVAIEEGATLVRVGTAIFGPRR